MRDFNLRDNLQSLFVPPRRNHFGMLDGLRAISVLWVIGFHCIFFISTSNLDLAVSLRNAPLLSWLKYGFRGVDIFFVISGFIIGHLLMKEHAATGEVGLKRFYLRRAVRLLPAYYAALALYFLIDPLTVKSVWANLLYVNNFLPIEQQFMGWAWSLAIEEQFYIVFPIALILLLKLDRRYRLPALGAAMLAVATVFVTVVRASTCQVPLPFQELGPSEFLCYFDTIYDKFHMRCGALLIGVTVAYLFNHTRATALLDAHAAWRRTLLALAVLLLVPATGFIETSGRGVFSTWFAFNSAYLFALGVGYIILFSLSEAGKRSVLARALSARVWYPLAQLSYSTYLIHPTLIILIYGWVLPPTRITPAMALLVGVVIACACFGAAAVLYLLVERPALNARARLVSGDGYVVRAATARSAS